MKKELEFTRVDVITKTGNHWIYPIEDIKDGYAITINGFHRIPLKVLNTNKPWHGNYYFTDVDAFEAFDMSVLEK